MAKTKAKAAAPTPTPTRRSLYELSADLLEWEAALEAADGELTPELEQIEQEVFSALEGKIDRIAGFARQLEYEADQADGEAKRIAQEVAWWKAKAKAISSRRARLLQLVDQSLTLLDRSELVGEVFTIRRVKNGGVASVRVTVDPEDLPREWQVIEVTVSPRTDVLRAALQEGDEAAQQVAELVPTGYRLVVR
jgi:hypothetical protein